MKASVTLLLVFTLLPPNTFSQGYTQLSLPDGATARLGKGSVSEVHYSPDGTRLAVASSIGIWLYDTATYQEIAWLAGHTGRVSSIAFSPDGGKLAGASYDGAVRLWDAMTGEHKLTLTGHTNWAHSVVFSPDGRTLASAGGDGTVLLWTLRLPTTWGAIKRATVAEDKGSLGALSPSVNMLAPKETALLANYPNPFNPETWLPYHLADDAEVKLTIYNTKGVLVRQLDLGHQSAGYYTDWTKAAYWNGCNESGESVASGVYFYQLRAGDYIGFRRMAILK